MLLGNFAHFIVALVSLHALCNTLSDFSALTSCDLDGNVNFCSRSNSVLI